MKNKNHSLIPYLICTISGLFFFYKYILQISPSVMSTDLMRDFHLTGTGLGNLAACFFYSYLIMQVPAGMLYDRFSPRLVIVFALLLSGLGTMLFSVSNSIWVAGLMRTVLGGTVAFALTGYLKFVTLWVPPKRFAFMSGFMMTIAMLGAISGEAPLAALVVKFGWRHAMLLTGFLGLGLALICWIFLRDKPAHLPITHIAEQPEKIWPSVANILKSKKNWLLGLYCGFSFAPFSAFAGLWGVQFLEQAHHLTRITAAADISAIFIGFAIGSPFLGWLSDYYQNRLTIMKISTFLAILCMLGIIYIPMMPHVVLILLLLFFGFFISVLMVSFAAARDVQDTVFVATLMGFLNMLATLFEALTDPLVGKFLDLGWDGQLVEGARVFSVANFHVAFALLPIYLFIAWILLFFVEGKKINSPSNKECRVD